MKKHNYKNLKKYLSKKYFIATLLIIFSLSFGIVLGFFGNLVKNQPVLSYSEMKEKLNDISINSDIYFTNGEKVATINSELIRKTIPLSDMGINIKNAIIASEDANFYNNMGVEPFAVLRATYNELTHRSISGGSTITQQLIKNQLLDNSRSYERKAKEILMSIRANKYFTKEEILETYLNMVPFGKNKLGQNINGIETASLGVFGMHSKDLNIAQAAYLAGFVQSPFRYTPFDSSGNLRSDEELNAGFQRQVYVLDRMLSEKFITKDEYNEALNFDIKSSFITDLKNETDNYPYITNEVITEVTKIFAKKMAEEEGKLNEFKNNNDYRNTILEKAKVKFTTGGYKVKTTIDKNLHDKLQEARDNYPSFITQNGQNIQLGATVIENKSGKILAFIGGRDFDNQQLNHATRTYRSPGSTIKPLLVYGPAIEKGYITPNSLLLDKKFDLNGWKPENYAKREFNLLTARKALAQSLNLSTIRLYSAFVNENPMDEYLKKMDFEGLTKSDETTLSAAIGGLDYGFTVAQNTSAFAALANSGEFNKAYIIEEIEDNSENIIYKHEKNSVQVYSKETSYLIVNMLHDVITNIGIAPDIAARLKFNSDNLFVKTGTSEYNHDLWTVGGTTNITFGLWTGYDQPQEIAGFTHAHNQWSYFMNVINEYNPELVDADKKFEQPHTVRYIGINQINNDTGSTLDLVPSGFTKLSDEKMYKKFGSLIDKNTQKTIKEINEEKEEEEKENKKKDKEKEDKNIETNTSSYQSKNNHNNGDNDDTEEDV
ncbi:MULTISPECIES: transglycosylase domain-containing protein [unclassified Gemella]|uniref:transglycosylase domain-containing protein n=1 Tax=unclassified Gemella TaxID=2624949 RepID=UPI001C04FF04|nr:MULTISPECIES: transglycosylase domain-containing protein [unclassified Gemella]MBU0278644.1 penicillin-binding protein [Gemella sp. zg-1178]QWQ39200.1 penicillin-binding protein [Gemella sp. zg-570]